MSQVRCGIAVLETVVMDFICPKCGSRSFMVLHGEPLQVECLKCGTVAPFSAAVGPAEDISQPPPLVETEADKKRATSTEHFSGPAGVNSRTETRGALTVWTCMATRGRCP